MNYRSFAFALGCLFLLANGAQAQKAYTPAAGSTERKAIMDALRVPCERDLNRKVIFRVDHLRVAGDLAFARVVPLQPNGNEIDYKRTKYREELEEGAFDGEGEALLRRQGGEWRVLEWRFGATDTEVDVWREKYRMPSSLLN
ncbi:MAG: hypothetical protein ABI883_06395 [Chthoniobacterales bacterium]